MNDLPVYLDSSAIVKLVVSEPETEALLQALAGWPERVSSSIAAAEVHRALWRARSSPSVRTRADKVLSAIALIHVDDAVLARAARLKDPLLRTLDAIHLASALSIGDDPAAFVTYDGRLARAALRQRLPVEHPGIRQL
jgi:predicted nucleic acid-binding protein